MSSADMVSPVIQNPLGGSTDGGAAVERPNSRTDGHPDTAAGPTSGEDASCAPGSSISFNDPERFIPLTRYALMDRLTRNYAWPPGQADEARRFFRYLDFWRQQSYAARMLEIEQNYEPFSPDSDLLITRKFNDADLVGMRSNLISQVEHLLIQANFVRIDPSQVDVILTKESAYGLDLQVDLEAFEEILIYYRGASTETRERRSRKKMFMKKEEFDVPIFQRLFVLFKLKPEEQRIREIRAKDRLSEKKARKKFKKISGMIPDKIKRNYVYMKMFKNIPCSDMEMCFPNTSVKFRMFDKVKLGVTAGGGLGMGIATTAGKLAAATTPVGMAAAALGLGGIAVRQASSYMNTRQGYMVTMAQNLYFHSMADNRGVITLMADRAVEEDIKEEMLLYGILSKEKVARNELGDIKIAIEQYLFNGFGIEVEFDAEEALGRLSEDGIVTQGPDGILHTLAPRDAAIHIDRLWDSYLDELPDPARGAGTEAENAETIAARAIMPGNSSMPSDVPGEGADHA